MGVQKRQTQYGDIGYLLRWLTFFATSVFFCPFPDDDPANRGAGVDMDNPVWPGRVQCHEHPFAVGLDKQLLECRGMVIVKPDNDHAAVPGFPARVDGDVIAIVKGFVIARVVHAFPDDPKDECMLAVLEWTGNPFFRIARREVVDGFCPVACLNP